MKTYRKFDFPVSNVRRLLEPGPIVLVSSFYKGETDIMTMGWHTVLEFSPSLIGCLISEANHSFELIRKSKECVINIPEVHLAKTVVDIGNCSGEDTDKFSEFELTQHKATKVKAPLINECYANLECKVVDQKMVKKYNFFVMEVVKAHSAKSPKYPRTIHYRGDGQFMVSGNALNLRSRFKPEML